MMRRFVIIAWALACVGCTSSISVVRVDADKPATRTGVAYHLPYTRFDVAVTRMVKACGAASITLATSVEAAVASAAIDLDQAYAIDPNSLAGVFRVGSVKAEYAKSGLVKSLNASAEDRTAQVIAAVASGVVKLATLPVAVAVATGSAVPACSQSTLASLAALPEATNEVKQASIELVAASAEYKSIQDRVTALGAVVDEATRRALVQARGRSESAATALVGKKAKLDRVKEALVHTDKFFWPANGSEFNAIRRPPENLLALWKNPEFKGSLPTPAGVDLRIVVSADKPDVLPSNVSPKEAIRGLPYRMPRPGYFYACDGDCMPANQLAFMSTDVLQLGTLYYLPCQIQTFGSTACVFTADENGIPSSVGIEVKSAAAENAASAFKDLATQYSGLRLARRDADKVAYEAETARLKAKSDYEKAVTSPQPPTEIQSLAEQTALLKAYVDYYTAMKAYADAKNAAPPP